MTSGTRTFGTWSATAELRESKQVVRTWEEDGNLATKAREKAEGTNGSGPMGSVATTLGFTKGLANYSSARADVFVQVPFDASDPEGKDKAFKEAYAFAQVKLGEVLRKVEKSLEDKDSGGKDA